MKIKAGNIWSGDRFRAVFTNPTELAFRKNNLKKHYPVVFSGETFEDAEAAYKHHKGNKGFDELQALMTRIISAKLNQHPILMKIIRANGGIDWVMSCEHFTYAHTSSFKRWEGKGMGSAFIRCLFAAYIHNLYSDEDTSQRSGCERPMTPIANTIGGDVR